MYVIKDFVKNMMYNYSATIMVLLTIILMSWNRSVTAEVF